MHVMGSSEWTGICWKDLVYFWNRQEADQGFRVACGTFYAILSSPISAYSPQIDLTGSELRIAAMLHAQCHFCSGLMALPLSIALVMLLHWQYRVW
jgi:hypothetical protein